MSLNKINPLPTPDVGTRNRTFIWDLLNNGVLGRLPRL